MSQPINDKTVESFGYQQELKRTLKTRDLVIFGLVFMAPVSAQTLYGSLMQVSQGHAVLAYLVGLIAMIFTAYSYGKMAGAYPIAGSTYSYTARAVHPYLGFMAGWGILLDYLLFPMLLFKISALFAAELLPFVPFWLILLVFAAVVSIFNFYGAKVTSRVNSIMTILMIISVIMFVSFAIKALLQGVGAGTVISMVGIYNPATFSWEALLAGASIAVLSYLGFDAVTAMAEDSDVSGSMVGKAAILACLVSTGFYTFQVYFATLVHPDFNAYQSPDTAFFEISTAAGGPMLATLITVIIALSGIATALAGQAAASRVLYGMGRDRALPRFFSYIHPKYKTPANNIIIMAIAGYIGALLIDLDVLFLIVVFGALIGFICVNLSVFFEYYIKRKKTTGIGVIQNLVLPLIGLIVCGYILYGMDPIGKTVGFLWLLLGVVFLAIQTKCFKKPYAMFE